MNKIFKEDYKKAAKIPGEVVTAKPDRLRDVQNYGLAPAEIKKIRRSDKYSLRRHSHGAALLRYFSRGLTGDARRFLNY